MPGLESYGIDEKNQAYYVNMLRQTQATVHGAEEYSDKKYRSDAKFEAENIYASDQIPEPNYRKKKQQRVPRQ